MSNFPNWTVSAGALTGVVFTNTVGLHSYAHWVAGSQFVPEMVGATIVIGGASRTVVAYFNPTEIQISSGTGIDDLDYTCTFADPLYYLALVTSEYQSGGSPNMLAWLKANLAVIQSAAACLASLLTAFDLSSAIGVQLDVIGVIVGQSRTVGFQPSGGASPVLDDPTYRTLLQCRVAQNFWNGQIDGLQAFWRNTFPGGSIVIEDHMDMSATVIVTGTFSPIVIDLITHGYIVAQAQSVLYNFITPTLPVLGFDQDTAWQGGFDDGLFV